MILRLILALAALALAIPWGEAASPAPPGASSCSGCHASNTSVDTPVPPLIGRRPAEIEQAMLAFRSGQKPAVIMDRIAKGFSPDEIKAIAAWYGEQKEGPAQR
jgi:cytochrome subunit of sulfide dehydrogenase